MLRGDPSKQITRIRVGLKKRKEIIYSFKKIFFDSKFCDKKVSRINDCYDNTFCPFSGKLTFFVSLVAVPQW